MVRDYGGSGGLLASLGRTGPSGRMPHVARATTDEAPSGLAGIAAGERGGSLAARRSPAPSDVIALEEN